MYSAVHSIKNLPNVKLMDIFEKPDPESNINGLAINAVSKFIRQGDES